MNQRKLDHEVKTLQVQAAQFAKQTGQWIGMVENFNQALKVGHTPYITGPILGPVKCLQSGHLRPQVKEEVLMVPEMSSMAPVSEKLER